MCVWRLSLFVLFPPAYAHATELQGTTLNCSSSEVPPVSFTIGALTTPAYAAFAATPPSTFDERCAYQCRKVAGSRLAWPNF